jgi:hypothetical protein
MAFPQVQDADTKTGSVTADSTSWTLTYPTSLVNGDLILAIIAASDVPGITFPAGFTDVTAVFGFDGLVRLWGAAKKSDGTETGDFTATLSTAEQGVWRVLRITGWYGDSATWGNSVAESNTEVTGNSTSPSPGANDPTNWGTEDTLWIALCAHDTGTTSVTAWPTFYDAGQISQNSGTTDGAGLGLARRENAVASEDADNFTLSTIERWGATTLAVRPAVASVDAMLPVPLLGGGGRGW